MSQSQSGFFENLKSLGRETEVKIAWLGLPGVGKSTLLEKITTGTRLPSPLRTVGVNVERYNMNGVRFVCWDIERRDVFKEVLWKKFLTDSLGIVFIVDCANIMTYGQAKEELWYYILDNPDCDNIPLLILANKSDLPRAAGIGVMRRKLDLFRQKRKNLIVEPVSATTGTGVEEALKWLYQKISENIS